MSTPVIFVPSLNNLIGFSPYAAPIGARYYTVSTNISDAQMETLNTVPLTLLAAPGANKVILPLAWFFEQNTSAAWSALPTLSLRYNGVALDIQAMTVTLSNAVGGRFMQFIGNNVSASQNFGVGVTVVNRALTLRATVNVTSGGPSTTPFRSRLFYTIVQVG